MNENWVRAAWLGLGYKPNPTQAEILLNVRDSGNRFFLICGVGRRGQPGRCCGVDWRVMNLNTTQYLTPLARQNNTPITGGNVLSVTTAINAWKCVFIRALSNDEEQGAHNVYIDLIDEGGRRLQPTAAMAIEYGWDGMQSNEKPPFAPLEKSSPEPLANIPLYRGQRLWVGVKDAIGSDIAQNFTSDPDGHQSFYVVFQRQPKATAPQKPNTITVGMDVILDIERRLAELTTAIHGLR